MAGYVYILATKRYGTIYVGVTANLVKRVWEHKNDVVPGFTKTYQVHDLVYYERHETIVSAIQREHTMKHWKRLWKTELVDGFNPAWDDLYCTIIW